MSVSVSFEDDFASLSTLLLCQCGSDDLPDIKSGCSSQLNQPSMYSVSLSVSIEDDFSRSRSPLSL